MKRLLDEFRKNQKPVKRGRYSPLQLEQPSVPKEVIEISDDEQEDHPLWDHDLLLDAQERVTVAVKVLIDETTPHLQTLSALSKLNKALTVYVRTNPRVQCLTIYKSYREAMDKTRVSILQMHKLRFDINIALMQNDQVRKQSYRRDETGQFVSVNHAAIDAFAAYNFLAFLHKEKYKVDATKNTMRLRNTSVTLRADLTPIIIGGSLMLILRSPLGRFILQHLIPEQSGWVEWIKDPAIAPTNSKDQPLAMCF